MFLFLPLLSFSQKVENVRFEQAGKQIHIYYDLQGEGTYNVEVFCSTNNGQSWGKPLREVTGAVRTNQEPGTNKKIVWDVLAEREKLTGVVKFKIEALPVNTGTFTDKRDGQTYKWVRIGNQIWMAENLNYKTRNSWCYDNITTNCNKYGRLYDWEAAKSACPKGWHLPTDDEWKELEMYLGMSRSEADNTGYSGIGKGEKLKSTNGWYDNRNGTDEVGFSALPGGYRGGYNGPFHNLGYFGVWWSATEYGSDGAWVRGLGYNNDKVGRNYDDKKGGFSVRCVRD